MNVREIAGLDAIRPMNVVDYLRSHGWVDTGSGDLSVAVYQRLTDRGDVEAKVLLDDSFSDFVVRMAEVADTISRVEARPLVAVVNDLLSPPGDGLRFRIDSERTEAGTISLQHIIAVSRGLDDPIGRATLTTIVEQLGETKVRVDLDAEQYKAAVDAHKEGQRVRLVGTLKKVGRGHVLEQHSGLEVVADER
jgi:hypothetical protein